nr:coiled coil domain containing protein 164 [Hymenolepis microstoma]
MDDFSRNLYFDRNNDSDKGPSVDSVNYEERIIARRNRIAERIASQQPGYYDEKNPNADSEDDKLIKVQITESIRSIANQCQNSNDFITNIRVSCDARESLRRAEEEKLDKERDAKFESELSTTEKLFEEIQSKWEVADYTIEPHDLRNLFEDLKNNCSKIIDEKNKLIGDIQLELKAKDDHFVKELKRRTDEVDMLVERMEAQMKGIQNAYGTELKEIEKAFLRERDNLLNEQDESWEDFIKELRKKQLDYLEERKHRIVELEDLIQKLRTNHSEEYNELNLHLSTEVQNMGTDLQRAKATYQLNLEKLEYNFQVLKRRDEENKLTLAQQKRKITQLQDQLNRLKIKSKNVKDSLKNENAELTEDYRRMKETFKQLQRKSKILIKSEEDNYRALWKMNEDEIRKYAIKLMKADKIITERELGMDWEKPDTSFMEDDHPKKLPAIESKDSSLAARIMKENEANAHKLSRKECSLPRTLKEASKEVVDEFLTLLAFEPEFLIEVKVKKILRDMAFEDQKLVRLDLILTMLEVNTEEKLDKLFTYFLLPFNGKEAKESDNQSSECDSGAPDNADASDDKETADCGKIEECVVKLIDPIDVSKVLYRFAAENCASNTAELINASKVLSSKSKVANLSCDHYLRTILSELETDTVHLQKYESIFASENKRQMWSALKRALQEYLEILRMRSRLINDNEGLKNQNKELRHLVKIYAPPEASQSLEMSSISP